MIMVHLMMMTMMASSPLRNTHLQDSQIGVFASGNESPNQGRDQRPKVIHTMKRLATQSRDPGCTARTSEGPDKHPKISRYYFGKNCHFPKIFSQ
jgi:hypothetical protein